MPLTKGVLHIHSRFSDGDESLDRLVQVLQRSGMRFAAVSDHAEVFDDRRMEEYVRVCEMLSSSSFLVIPGLEFALKGGTLHILGYGIRKRLPSTSMDLLVDGIHDSGGLAVLAHPPVGSINLIGSIKGKLDGIEVWNGRYDGAVAPRAGSFQLLRQVRSLNSKVAAFCGVDLHQIAQARKLIYMEVEADHLQEQAILDRIRARHFTLHGGNTVIPATGQLTFVQELSIAIKQPLCRPWTG
jgi:predicted metal-dependent phosphoesterase TrpH